MIKKVINLLFQNIKFKIILYLSNILSLLNNKEAYFQKYFYLIIIVNTSQKINQ
jgi:hypothetical protein